MRTSRTAVVIVRHFVLAVFIILMFLPFIWVVFSSFKPSTEVFQFPFHLLPSSWHLSNYTAPFHEQPLARYFANSLGVAIVVTASNLLFDSMVAWGLAQFRFPGRNLLFFFILSTMMLPVQVIVVPLFLIIKSFGWLNSYLALTTPALLSGFGVFLMRQWFLAFPRDLLDSARIDGASELHIFFRIAIPSAGPSLGALAIFIFTANWDSFLWPLVVVNKRSLMTMPLGIANFLGEYQTAYNQLMAVSVMGMIPMLIVFLIFQRQFVEGIITTGMKG